MLLQELRKVLYDFLKSLFPSKLEAFDDVEVFDVGSLSLNGSCLAPGQTFSGFMLQKVFKDKPVYI